MYSISLCKTKTVTKVSIICEFIALINFMMVAQRAFIQAHLMKYKTEVSYLIFILTFFDSLDFCQIVSFWSKIRE